MNASSKIIYFSLIIFIIPILPQKKSDNYYKSFFSISKDSLKQHIEILGDDSLQGRGTDSLGAEKSAEYIKNKFEEIGLNPVKDNSFFQNIQMHESIPQTESELKIFINDSSYILKLQKDYVLINSVEQTYIPIPIQLVFVGYGIIAPEYDYNDYQSVDPGGKIVMMLEGEPESDDPNYFNEELSTIYSYEEAKQRLAIKFWS